MKFWDLETWLFGSRDNSNGYRYCYLRHPFDLPQHFIIEAETQSEADEKAVMYMTELFKKGQTVMTTFWSTG